MHPTAAVLGGLGLALVVGSFLGADRPGISPLERRVFQAINHRSDGWFPVLWGPMQLGNLVVGTFVGLGISWWRHDVALAVAVLAAALGKLLVERVLRHRFERLREVRQRPGTSQPDAILRGRDVPSSGPSFPSGHVILVAAVGAVIARDLPAHLAPVPLLVAVVVAVGRVYVGAHNPLDTTAGLGLGMVLGALLTIPLR